MTDITIVLPVQNVAETIGRRLSNLLESVSEMTSRFEIVVVDDASSDQTAELTSEFCGHFPQIRLRRHYEARGLYSAIRTGCRTAKSKRVFVQTTDQPFSPSVIARFWESGAPNNLLEISDRRPIQAVDDQLIGRLSAWCDALKQEKLQRQGLQRQGLQRLEADPCEADRSESGRTEVDRIQRLDQAEESPKRQVPNILNAPLSDFGSILGGVVDSSAPMTPE